MKSVTEINRNVYLILIKKNLNVTLSKYSIENRSVSFSIYILIKTRYLSLVDFSEYVCVRSYNNEFEFREVEIFFYFVDVRDSGLIRYRVAMLEMEKA